MEELAVVTARLKSQVSRGEPVLFLGAGFSLEALDIQGRKLPSTRQLTEAFWKLAFPSEAFDSTASLGDAYYSAKKRDPKGLLALIRDRLSVNAELLDDFYATWFSIPWARCYTLNIDDLEQAVARKFTLPRSIYSLSATSRTDAGNAGSDALAVVHLNGAVWDQVEGLTFSELDYAARLTKPDQWYISCTTDILSRPVVFVGTELEESTFWQYVEFRRGKSPRGMRELRPGSYLISPTLNRARQLLLKELNIDWVPMTARDFEISVLKQLGSAIEEGRKAIRANQQAAERRSVPQLVADLASLNPTAKTEYLLGQEPSWADLHTGRAIYRDCDEEVYKVSTRILSSADVSPPLLVTGTAGSGKSTSLMRLGMRLSAEGLPVYWIDEQSNIEPHRLREVVLRTDKPVAILVDDADLWGNILSGWARELSQLRPSVLFAMALRSAKVDGLVDPVTLGGIQPYEITMPPLTDSDIESLITVLDGENRLGVLKGKSHEERVEAFQQEAGRQLLVAMIQATSGKRFREKCLEEFLDLSETQKLIYAVVCLVSSQRFTLDREEILLATGRPDNETLNALEQLVQRYLIVRYDIHSGYNARHRVIADEVVNAMQFRQFVGPVLEGVCFAFANRISPNIPRSSRQWRRLIRFTNHDYLIQMTRAEVGRTVYETLEPLLHWEFNYWLQRGSLEVEEGDLDLATNFLNQARSLAPGHRSVETEYAYLLMKKAARSPTNTSAPEWFNEGREVLEDLIREHGKQDPYPYHVLGSQGLAWVRQARLPLLEKRSLLRRLLDTVKAGVENHPRAEELPSLAKDLEKEWLSTAVSANDS